jgi:hypothetical protein
VLYIVMMLFIKWDGYSPFSQTVSELSAFGAPTRTLWLGLGAVYSLLVIAFGLGVLTSAGTNRPLRVVGALILTDGIFGAFWPPMHLREVLAAGGGTLSDPLHVFVWSPVMGLLFRGAMGFGAFAFGTRFRVYSFVSMSVVTVFGAVLTGIGSRGLDKNLPTPWLGVWERVGIAGFMVWVLVLGVVIMRSQRYERPCRDRARTVVD